MKKIILELLFYLFHESSQCMIKKIWLTIDNLWLYQVSKQKINIEQGRTQHRTWVYTRTPNNCCKKMELVKSWSGPNTNTPNNRSRMGREGNRKAYPLSDLRRRQSARGSTTLLAALVPPLAAHAALLPAPPPATPRPPPAPAQGSRHHRRRAMHREREEGETEGKRRTEASDGGGCSGARRRVREMGATDASCWILLFFSLLLPEQDEEGE
jgi:hypothetical protein